MLKNILSLLLSKFYSKKENEAVGHQAMPSGISTTLLSNAAVSDWSTVSSGVAASDGYLVLTAKNAGNAGASLSLNVREVARQSLTYPFIGAGGNAFVPIGKGDSWALIGSSSENITLRLFKTIGGYQALSQLLLQGGVLCRLKHLYSSLRRSSCRVKDRGFNTQSLRPRMQYPSALQPTANGTNLHPVQMVTSHFQETPQALFWKSLMVAQVSLILNQLQDGTLFLYRKVKNLGISFQQIQRCRICTLSQCEVQTNLKVGGASC